MSRALFYEEKYYMYSNFSAHIVVYKDALYPTSEHAYQAAKFTDTSIKEEIRAARSPLVAKRLANRTYKTQQMKNWDEIKVDIMYEIVKEKLLQHDEIREMLLQTEEDEIVENSPKDYFWGCGSDNTGQNQLGKIWMRLREELRETKV